MSLVSERPQSGEPGLLRPPRSLDLVGLVARLLLGGVMLVAGLLKVTKPDVSARAVQAYQILPFDLATYVGYGLPILEILLGALLVLGLFTRTAAAVSGVLLVAFIIGIASAWARGISIDCGCFGQGGTIDPSQARYLEEILRDVGLVLGAVWLVTRPRTAYSLERTLFA